MGRKKLSPDRKKINMKVSIDSDLMGLYESYLSDNGITHKSKLIEQELSEVIKSPILLRELLDNGILPEDNNLLG